MTRRMLLVLIGFAVLTAIVGAALGMLVGRRPTMDSWTEVGRTPAIRPDYANIVIPPNIAPLNFIIEDRASHYVVRIRSARGRPIEIDTRSAAVIIPPAPWHDLLAANRGEQLEVEVFAYTAGAWRRFQPLVNRIAPEDIDGHLVYRKIKPLYNFYGPIGVYQRDLHTYAEKLIFHNNKTENRRGCPNCHTFLSNRADTMIMHVRGPSGGMLLLRDGQLQKVDTRTKRNSAPAAFASWHPSGKLLAFSIDNVQQFFHTARPEVRDAYDLDSDIVVYLIESRSLATTAKLRQPDRLEVFPCWSADGRHLYFSSAQKLWTKPERPPTRYNEVRYSLMRISYDIGTGQWGELETVVSAEQLGKSVTQAKASPDGRHLLVCLSDYSMQPSFQTNADLFLLDLQSGQLKRLECNSDLSESWHSWSSNSRWIVFSSRRGDGQFARTYFSYIDREGRAAKPFVLPQEDPAFYDSCIMLYQLPELVREEVPLREDRVLDVIHSEEIVHSDAITGASPMVSPSVAPGGQN